MRWATHDFDPCRTGISRGNGGSIAIGEMAITSKAAISVQVPRIAPNCSIGMTSLIDRAPRSRSRR